MRAFIAYQLLAAAFIAVSAAFPAIAEGAAASGRHQLEDSYDELMQLGTQHIRSNNLDLAAKTFEGALSRASNIGDKTRIAAALYNIGVAFGVRGDLAHSEDALGKALKLYKETDNAKGIADVHGALGIVYRRRGDTGHAVDSYRSALSFFEKTGDKASMALTASNLGIVYAGANDIPHAEDMFLRSARYSDQIGAKQTSVLAHRNLGSLYLQKGDPSKACAHWTIARHLLLELSAQQLAQSLESEMALAKCQEP